MSNNNFYNSTNKDAEDQYAPVYASREFKKQLYRTTLKELTGRPFLFPVKQVCIVAAALLVLVVGYHLYQISRVVGRAYLVKGTFNVEKKVFQASAVGHVSLKKGKELATGADSLAELKLKDGSTVWLEESTELAINRLRHLYLNKGEICLQVKRDDKAFELETPNAKVVVISTVLTVSHLKGSTVVTVLEGMVEVHPSAEQVFQVSQYEKLVINRVAQKSSLSATELAICRTNTLSKGLLQLAKEIKAREAAITMKPTKVETTPVAEKTPAVEPEKKDLIIRGKVMEREEDARPIVGAQLELFIQEDFPSTQCLALTNVQGQYEFHDLSPVKYVIIARAQGYVAKFEELIELSETDPVREVNFELRPIETSESLPSEGLTIWFGSIQGRVTDEKGHAFPLARVECVLQNPDGSFTYAGLQQLANLEGRFAFYNLSCFPSKYGVIASYKNLKPDYRTNITLSEAGQIEEVNLVLRKEALTSLEGVVIDGEGEPVAGATVYAGSGIQVREFQQGQLSGDRLLGGLAATTDSDGLFSIPEIYVGDLSVIACKEGYLVSKPRKLSLSTTGKKEFIEIVLLKGAVIEGMVVDQEQKPIADARVRTVAHRLPRSVMTGYGGGQQTRTSTEGKFKLTGLERDGTYYILVQADGFAEKRLETPPNTKGLVITLKSGGIISGRVFRADTSEPVSGIDVIIYSSGDAGYIRTHVQTDENGYYRFSALPDGTYALYPRGEGLTAPPKTGLKLEKASQLTEINFEVHPGMDITGRVIDADTKEPVEGRITCLVGSHASIAGFLWNILDEEGRFIFDNMPEGSYRLVVKGTGYADYWHDIEWVTKGEDIEVEIELHKGRGAVYGTVTDSQGHPVVGATVEIFQRFAPMEAQVDTYDKKAITDATGNFSIKGIEVKKANLLQMQLKVPTLWLAVRHPSFSLAISEGFVLSDEQPERQVNIVLHKGGLISGKVFAPDNKPLPGVRIRAFCGEEVVNNNMEKMNVISTVSEDEGIYLLEHIGPGEVTLTADVADFAPQSKKVSVEQDGQEITGVDFHLTKGLSISGRVLDFHKKPISSARIMLFRGEEPALPLPDQVWAQTMTDAEGKFTFSNLPDDIFFIYAFYETHQPWGVLSKLLKAKNVPSGSTDLEIISPQEGAISGAVYDQKSGDPIEHIIIKMSLEKPEEILKLGFFIEELRFQTTEGKFELPGLPPARFKISITAEGYSEKELELEVKPGQVTDIGNIYL